MDTPTLILDADDTLWENNVFYEEATDTFIELMVQEGFDHTEARQTLTHVEHDRIPTVGYSPHEFVRSLAIAYHRLCKRHKREAHPQVESRVSAIGQQVVEYPITLLEGVAETLPSLRQHCQLILLTKGDHQTQHSKVERSGLAPYFETIHVVAEKGADVLQDLMARHDLDRARTWMVGNSPRSDINPALEVGIGAIYIPYAKPWDYEQVPIADPDRVVTLRSFSDLADLFPEPEKTE
ncbi:MAG: HAD family hydrolase [Anaerolineae bacterium]|jgi:putative hydrolase of the HAD superfamily